MGGVVARVAANKKALHSQALSGASGETLQPVLVNDPLSPYYGGVNPTTALVDRLKLALMGEIEADPSAWRGVTSETLDRIATVCASALQGINEPEQTEVVDPVSGLKLPPEPEILYSNAFLKYGRRLTPEEFIQNEKWSLYREAGLLYSEFIRQADISLYHALNYRAKSEGVRATEYMRQIGILDKKTISNPPSEFVRQARLIKSAQVRAARRSDAPGGR